MVEQKHYGTGQKTVEGRNKGKTVEAALIVGGDGFRKIVIESEEAKADKQTDVEVFCKDVS